MTIQEKMRETLEKSGLPFKEIEVYGRQIVITCWSRKAAEKWSSLVSQFSTLRGITHSRDYAKKNKNTCLRPSTIEVWRVFSSIV